MRRELQGSAAGTDSLIASGMPWAEHVRSWTRFDKAQTQAGDSRTQARAGDSCAQTRAGDSCTQAQAGDSCTQTQTVDSCTQTQTVDSCTQAQAGDSCTQTRAGDSCTQTRAGDSCTQTRAGDSCTQTRAGDSCTQAGKQVQLPKADALTDPVVKTGEQLSQDNAQTEAVLDRTRDGTSVGLAESGSTLPEASLRPLQRRVVAKKRRRLTLLFTSNPISVQEDKSESTLAGTDDVEMAIIEPQTSNQTDIHDAGKRSRKEKKLARRESRPVKISWHPNKITFAFG